MARVDRWLRRAASAVPGETLLATLIATTPGTGQRGSGRPCVLIATSGHVVLHVPRLRRSQTTTLPLGGRTDVSVDDHDATLTIRVPDGDTIQVTGIADPVGLEAFVAVLDRDGRRHLPDDPSHRKPGHGHVTRVPGAQPR